MGETRPRTDLDRAYRRLVAAWLIGIRDRHHFTSQAQLAEALGSDRSTVSRYISMDTRAPLQRLQYAQRTIGEAVPKEIEDAFWESEPVAPAAAYRDIETNLRQAVDEALTGLSQEEQLDLLHELQKKFKKR